MVSFISLCVVLLSGCGLFGSGGQGAAGASSEPTPTPRTGPAETRTAVSYAPVSDKQTLDLYLPEGDGNTVYPMVVLIHGGGFFTGGSQDETERAKLLASKGFAAASLNYRLSGDAPYPAGVQDVKAAIRYLRANALAWGVDPHRIAVWGESAGGYLAAMAGATGGGSTLFDDASLGNPHVSSAVSAVVTWFGPFDFSTMDEQAGQAGCDEAAQQHNQEDSPESKWMGAALPSIPDKVAEASVVKRVEAAEKLPPYLLVHGEQDCTVPPGQSQQLYDALKAKDLKATLTFVPGAAHSDPKIVDEQTEPTIEFLRSALGATRSG